VNPRGIVTATDHELIRAARTRRDIAEREFRETVLAVASRSSVRETAKAAAVSPDTISRWKRGD